MRERRLITIRALGEDAMFHQLLRRPLQAPMRVPLAHCRPARRHYGDTQLNLS